MRSETLSTEQLEGFDKRGRKLLLKGNHKSDKILIDFPSPTCQKHLFIKLFLPYRMFVHSHEAFDPLFASRYEEEGKYIDFRREAHKELAL